MPLPVRVFPIRVEIVRDGLHSQWGFRLKGGVDVDGGIPLEITKVFVGSGAEGVLVPGDKVIAVNSQDTTSLTHIEAQNLIKGLGTSAALDVVRPGQKGENSYVINGGKKPATNLFKVGVTPAKLPTSPSTNQQPYRTKPLSVPKENKKRAFSDYELATRTVKSVIKAKAGDPEALNEIKNQPFRTTPLLTPRPRTIHGNTKVTRSSRTQYGSPKLPSSFPANRSMSPSLNNSSMHPGYVPSSKPKLPSSKDPTFSRPHVSETFKMILESEIDKARDEKGVMGSEFRKDSHPHTERPSSSNSNKSHDPLMMDDSICQSASFKRVMHRVLDEY